MSVCYVILILKALELQYAHDNAIYAHSEENLWCMLDAFVQAGSWDWFSSCHQKLSPPPAIHINSTNLKSVNHFPYLGSLLSFILTLIKKYIIMEAVPVGPLYNPGGFCGPLHTSGDQTTCSQVVLPALLYGAKILSINWKDKHSYISVLEEANTNRTATTII